MAQGPTEKATDGVDLPITDLAISNTWALGGSVLATQTVVYNSITYRKTYTNDGVSITNVSQWIPQIGP